MTEEKADSADTFEIQRIRKLVDLMKQFDLAEVDLRQGGQRIRLKRGGEPVVLAPTSLPASPGPPPPTIAPAAEKQTASQPEDAGALYVKSPMVGTYYASANPDAPPFIKIGDHVGPDTIVCIVEAMKVFNDIPAGVSGKVTASLVENGDPVEFGQPLFRIDANG